jgi:nucleoside-diphosphate-sugar epimerase
MTAPEPATEQATQAARRRVWVTGGSGFVGRAIVRHLVARGDEVTVSVRDARRVEDAADLAGATIVESDLSDVRRLGETFRDGSVSAVIHAAGSYRVGITKAERGAMWDANIGSTTRILDAAEAGAVGRLVYLSTCGILGNTRGRIVDETWRRDVADGFVSWYDETKFGAHEVVQQRARAGAPVVTVLPSQVYGPGDHSMVGQQLESAFRGTLRYRVLDEVGLGFVHVDDLARGIVAAMDDGRIGEQYILSGPQLRVVDVTAVAARLGGHPLPPKIPTGVLRLFAPIAGFVGRAGLPELVASASGTFWGSSAKATAELGFTPREIEAGLRDTFGLPRAMPAPDEALAAASSVDRS